MTHICQLSISLLLLASCVGHLSAQGANEAPVEGTPEYWLRELEAVQTQIETGLELWDLEQKAQVALDKQLREEYYANSVEISTLDPANAETAPKRAALIERQKKIALFVGELERRSMAGPRIALSSVRRDLQQFSRRYQRDITLKKETDVDRQIKEKLAELEKRVETSENDNFPRRNDGIPNLMRRGEFYDITDQLNAINHETSAPRTLPPERYAVEGAIQTLRTPLRRMLALKQSDDKLVLDRDHWGDLFAGMSRQEISDEVQRLLRERSGAPLPDWNQDEFPLRIQREIRTGMTRDTGHLGCLWENLAAEAMRLSQSGGGRSGSGSGDRIDSNIRNGLIEASLQSTPEIFRFVVDEVESPNRSLAIAYDQSGELRIVLTSEGVFKLLQDEDGTFTVVDIWDDEVFRASAKSFAAFRTEHPAYTEETLLPLLDHCGIAVRISAGTR